MNLKNFTILYVEDSRVLREFIKNTLQNYAKEVYVASDGKEGLEQFAKYKPDIVISDINMPNIDGLQMSRMIKHSYKETPIILLTEFEKADYLKRAILLGINSFLSKPVEEEKLLHLLENIASELQNRIDAKKLKELEANQEKINLMIVLLREIGHHWRQPLSAILAISTGYEIKKMSGLYSSLEEELKDINTISEQVKKLSLMLKSIEDIDFHSIQLEDIEEIIKISDPIYC